MRRALFFILLFSGTCLRAKGQDVQTKAQSSIENVEWLVGMWERTNSKAGRTGHERWLRDSNSQLTGYGVTMKGKDTVFVEKLHIIVKNSSLYYVADVPNNQQPVYFMLTLVSPQEFSCENLLHDFPKNIVYKLEKDNLNATVSGNGRSLEYHFTKKVLAPSALSSDDGPR